jgi:ribosomal-protein-alanine N-acetyltransferase
VSQLSPKLHSERVLLRHWRESDLRPWISLNLDPDNLKFFPRVYTKEESEASFKRMSERLENDSFGLWAAEEKASGEFMGFVGLANQDLPGISFMPCVEIGWRLDKKYWGKGYATEAAKVVLGYGLIEQSLPTIYSYTAISNLPSINVMTKIGLHLRSELAFEHPKIEIGNPMRSHVVYST